MSGELKAGAVLAWDGFQFDDGGTADKLLIVLGAKTGKDYLLVLTTSKPHKRKFNAGCHAEDGYYHIPGGGKDFFNVDTWVLLARPQLASSAELLKHSFTKELHVAGNLRDQVVNAIRNCLKLCDDVSQAHLDCL